MARTKAEIFSIITQDFISKANVIEDYNLVPGQTFEEQFSIASLEYTIFDTIANSIYTHELVVETNVKNSKLQNVDWYKKTALEFLDGLEIIFSDGYFSFNTENITDLDERKIISRCAVSESNDGALVIKVATDNGGVISPLTNAQLDRFINYMNLVKHGGNRLRFINQNSDKLRLTIDAYVDVSIIELSSGKLLNTTSDVYPVKQGIEKYLKNLEFNGAFVPEFLREQLKLEPGVKIPVLTSIEWKYADFDWTNVGDWKVPQAGYFSIDELDLTINYIEYDLAEN
ncbi:hypothetical protein [Flavobacterium sp.]|uniref:hypothetical protein n=1 Tax=Flavobacterium sp. TaxID=239 RepID=UPI00262D51FC|nr:hypothetical protein [Flavobacterium sp.]